METRSEHHWDLWICGDGTRYYKVRWVKYSWEPAASFTHLEHLISEFWSQFGENPDDLHANANKRQADCKQLSITQELPSQVQVHQPGQVDRPVLNSILTSLANLPPIVENVSHVQSAPTIQLQTNVQQLGPGSFPQLTTLASGNVQHVEILPAIQHIHLAANPASLVQPDVSDFVKNKPNNIEEAASKKRRKIPGNCPICGKYFKSTTNIAAHKKLHTEERQYECQECNRKFRRKLHLRRHLESHAGIKGFLCNICGASFSSKWYMQAHAVIHTGDKPFQCDVCEKRFNNKANLHKHKLIHANKRPFVCNICGHSYRQSYDLKRHMSTHNSDKSFSCEQCGKSFARKTYLQRHLMTHNGEKKYTCSICNRKFFQKGRLNFHMKQHEKKMAKRQLVNAEVLSNDPINLLSDVACGSSVQAECIGETNFNIGKNKSTNEEVVFEVCTEKKQEEDTGEKKFSSSPQSALELNVQDFREHSNKTPEIESNLSLENIVKEQGLNVNNVDFEQNVSSDQFDQTRAEESNLVAEVVETKNDNPSKQRDTYLNEQGNNILEFATTNQEDVNIYLT